MLPLFETFIEKTESCTSTVKTAVVQKQVDEVINKKNWKRLHVLFMGGGSDQKYRRGEGGFATGCDASSAPLDEVIESEIDRKDMRAFVKTLLQHGAPIKGLPGCKKSPLAVARETKQHDVISLLREHGVEDTSAAAREYKVSEWR